MVTLHLCVNDDNGDVKDRCLGIDVDIAGELAMEIETDLAFQEIEDQMIRIGNHVYQYRFHNTMVGNVYWNAYTVNLESLVRLCNYLKKNNEVNLDAAWSELYDKWESDSQFTNDDFELAAAANK